MPIRPPSRSFHQKLDQILKHAAEVFYEKGYEGASIRDISRRSNVSLAGLYYYFESKEKLLYLIQKHCFTTILSELERRLRGTSDPERQLQLLIANHLSFFLRHYAEMKVLSHEADVLTNRYQREIAEIKRSYFKICLGILEELKQQKRLKRLNPRVAVLSLFGMMNWIYTWYDPRKDPDADGLAEAMATIFFGGILEPEAKRSQKALRKAGGAYRIRPRARMRLAGGREELTAVSVANQFEHDTKRRGGYFHGSRPEKDHRGLERRARE